MNLHIYLMAMWVMTTIQTTEAHTTLPPSTSGTGLTGSGTIDTSVPLTIFNDGTYQLGNGVTGLADLSLILPPAAQAAPGNQTLVAPVNNTGIGTGSMTSSSGGSGGWGGYGAATAGYWTTARPVPIPIPLTQSSSEYLQTLLRTIPKFAPEDVPRVLETLARKRAELAVRGAEITAQNIGQVLLDYQASKFAQTFQTSGSAASGNTGYPISGTASAPSGAAPPATGGSSASLSGTGPSAGSLSDMYNSMLNSLAGSGAGTGSSVLGGAQTSGNTMDAYSRMLSGLSGSGSGYSAPGSASPGTSSPFGTYPTSGRSSSSLADMYQKMLGGGVNGLSLSPTSKTSSSNSLLGGGLPNTMDLLRQLLPGMATGPSSTTSLNSLYGSSLNGPAGSSSTASLNSLYSSLFSGGLSSGARTSSASGLTSSPLSAVLSSLMGGRGSASSLGAASQPSWDAAVAARDSLLQRSGNYVMQSSYNPDISGILATQGKGSMATQPMTAQAGNPFAGFASSTSTNPLMSFMQTGSASPYSNAMTSLFQPSQAAAGGGVDLNSILNSVMPGAAATAKPMGGNSLLATNSFPFGNSILGGTTMPMQRKQPSRMDMMLPAMAMSSGFENPWSYLAMSQAANGGGGFGGGAQSFFNNPIFLANMISGGEIFGF